MKTQDEKIQESIEQGKHEGQDSDSKAYKIVFQAIKKEPIYRLSPTFTEEVVNRILQSKEERAIHNDLVWLGVGLLMFLMASIVTGWLVNFKFDYGAFKFLSTYNSLFIFGIILVLTLLWIERRVLPSKKVISTSR